MHLCIAIIAILLVGAEPAENKDLVKKDVAKLQGRWIADWYEYGGKKYPAGRDSQTWDIVGDRITRYDDSKKLDVIAFEVAPAETPKDLDLLPVKGEKAYEQGGLVAQTKMIYLLEDDLLKVGFSYELFPISPETEKQRAIKWAESRPKSFETKDGGVMVVVFKRAKKESDGKR